MKARNLTPRHLIAAKLVAEGDLTFAQIARSVSAGLRTIDAWRTWPEFQAEVDRFLNALRESLKGQSIADRNIRLQSYVDDFHATSVILKQRGAELQEAAGGKTGYICRDVRGLSGIDVYKFDAALMAERNELRERIAIELGEWKQKVEHSGSVMVERLNAGRERVAKAKESGCYVDRLTAQ